MPTRRNRHEVFRLAWALLATTACSAAERAQLPEDSRNPLTPAASLAGTWRSAFAISFRLQTDACGRRETFAEERWNVTWIIRAVPNNPNRVSVEMQRSPAGAAQRFTQSCGEMGTGYVPWNTGYFDATLSSSAISATGSWKVSGSFTTDLLAVTWDHWECVLLCYGETTGSNELKLTRQR